MKKFLKGISLLGLSTLAIFMFVTIANANAGDDDEEPGNCITYKNYFYFSQASYQQFIKEKTDNYTKTYDSTTKYLFPMNGSVKREGVICLKNGNTTQSINSNNCIDTWTLERYYDSDPTANGPGHEETFEGNTYTYYESGTGNTVERHYFHGKWVNTDGVETDADRPYPADRDVALASMTFPTHTTITRSNGLHFALSRQYDDNSVPSTTPDNGWFYAPAVYYVEYEVCEEEPTYNATINYYYEGTTTKVEFQDTTKANPYTESDLADGYTNAVTSPTAANASCVPLEGSVTIKIEGRDYTHNVYYRCSTFTADIHYCIEKDDGTCIPATDVDKSAKDYSKTDLANGAQDTVKSPTIKNCKVKKDADKSVSYKINNADFEYTVRYICEETPAVSPKTGIALIVAAWLVGLGALGYSAYYFINAKKEGEL